MKTCDTGLPMEQPEILERTRRSTTIGLPAPQAGGGVPLTPEGAGLLVDRGYRVLVEQGAAAGIHYPDSRYTRWGAEVVPKSMAWGADVVIHRGAVSEAQARMMRPGATLFTMLDESRQQPRAVAELLRRRITSLALDLIQDNEGNTPFADILAEIDGRAAVVLGSAILADADSGKGILLGGVAGIVPCEVTIIGAGIAACAAVRCASGLGATVRMFDNDVYRLRRAVRELGPQVVSSALHPNVLRGALRSADLVVATASGDGGRLPRIGYEMISEMKQGVVIFDLSGPTAPMFPSLNAAQASQWHSRTSDSERVALVNPGDAVARTSAMALSNTLVSLFDKITVYDNLVDALRRMPGLRSAVYTYLGRVVNPGLAKSLGMRQIDINIYLTMS